MTYQDIHTTHETLEKKTECRKLQVVEKFVFVLSYIMC